MTRFPQFNIVKVKIHFRTMHDALYHSNYSIVVYLSRGPISFIARALPTSYNSFNGSTYRLRSSRQLYYTFSRLAV